LAVVYVAVVVVYMGLEQVDHNLGALDLCETRRSLEEVQTVVVKQKMLVEQYSLVVTICLVVSHDAEHRWEMVDVVVELEECSRYNIRRPWELWARKVDLVEARKVDLVEARKEYLVKVEYSNLQNPLVLAVWPEVWEESS